MYTFHTKEQPLSPLRAKTVCVKLVFSMLYLFVVVFERELTSWSMMLDSTSGFAIVVRRACRS